MTKRILFVGAGRRTEMAKKWISAGYEILSYESSQLVPISRYANIFVGKKFSDPEFSNNVAQLARLNDIDLIIPFQDEAAVYLSRDIELFDKLNLVVSPYETCRSCFDKAAFQAVFEEKDYYPKVQSAGDNIFAKPRFGFGGKGNMNDFVIQRHIEGIEYTVDCYFNPKSILIDFVPRIRLRTFDGEVISSITVEPDVDLNHIIFNIVNTIPFVGPVNMQFIKSKDDDRFYLIEINPRFGGGYTLSMQAGMDVIHLIAKDYLGEPKHGYTSLNWIRGLKVERALQDFYFREEVS